MVNYLLRRYREKASHFSFVYLLLGYMCVMKSVSYTMSVGITSYDSVTTLKYIFWYPVLSFLEICPRIIPKPYSTHILYEQKLQTCNYLLCGPMFETCKKQRNPVARENKTHEDNSHPNCVLKQMPPKFCVTKIYSLKGHLSTI